MEKVGRGYKPRPVKENRKGGLMVSNHGIGNPKSCTVLRVRQNAQPHDCLLSTLPPIVMKTSDRSTKERSAHQFAIPEF